MYDSVRKMLHIQFYEYLHDSIMLGPYYQGLRYVDLPIGIETRKFTRVNTRIYASSGVEFIWINKILGVLIYCNDKDYIYIDQFELIDNNQERLPSLGYVAQVAAHNRINKLALMYNLYRIFESNFTECFSERLYYLFMKNTDNVPNDDGIFILRQLYNDLYGTECTLDWSQVHTKINLRNVVLFCPRFVSTNISAFKRGIYVFGNPGVYIHNNSYDLSKAVYSNIYVLGPDGMLHKYEFENKNVSINILITALLKCGKPIL